MTFRAPAQWFIWSLIFLSIFVMDAASSAVSTKQPPKSLYFITINHSGPGVLSVRYELPRNTRTVPLANNQASLRNVEWAVKTPGVTLQPTALSLTPIASEKGVIDITVNGHSRTPDRVYPILISLSGGGVVVNTAAFVPPGLCSETKFLFVPGPNEYLVMRGHTYRHHVSVNADCSGEHNGSYLYMGRQSPSNHAGSLFLADTNTPQWILHSVQPTLGIAVNAYRRWFHRNLGYSPSIFVTYQRGPIDQSWWRGDVLDSGTVRLTFAGDAWLKQDPDAKEQIRRFIAHEAFHLWNGSIKTDNTARSNAWLLEGGAELASSFLLAQEGWDKPLNTTTYINSEINTCLLQSGDHTWQGIQNIFIGGSIYYTCGVTFNYMAALSVDPSHPRKGFAKIWARTLNDSWPSYSLASFLKDCYTVAALPLGCTVLKQVVESPKNSLSSAIEHLLTAANVPFRRLATVPTKQAGIISDEMQTIPNSQALLHHLTDTLLLSNLKIACGGDGQQSIGYWWEQKYLKLDIPANCRTVLDIGTVKTISGVEFLKTPSRAYEAARIECNSKGYLSLGSVRDRFARLRCHSPLLPIPSWFYLEHLASMTEQP
jgi:hypothetical protein